MENWMRKGWKE